MTNEIQKSQIDTLALRSDVSFSPQIRTLVERRVVKAASSAKVTTLLAEKAGKREIAELIEQMFIRAGQISGFKLDNIQASKDRAEINLLIQNVLLDYAWLCKEELNVIFQEGLKGNLGEYYGINPRVVNEWVKAYDKKIRQPTLKKQMEFEAQVSKEHDLKPADVYAQTAQSIRDIYKKIHKVGRVDIGDHHLISGVLFELLQHANIIVMDSGEKLVKYSQALAHERKTCKLGTPEETLKARAKSRCRVDAFVEAVRKVKDVELLVQIVEDVRLQNEQNEQENGDSVPRS